MRCEICLVCKSEIWTTNNKGTVISRFKDCPYCGNKKIKYKVNKKDSENDILVDMEDEKENDYSYY